MTRKEMENERASVVAAARIASDTIQELFVQLQEAKERIRFLEKQLRARKSK